jgi:hypothetical protein
MGRRALNSLIAGLLLCSCGCMMPLGVAYPTISSTPFIPIQEEIRREIHAFRVTFEESRRSKIPEEWDKCTFEELELKKNEIPGQTTISISYEWSLYAVPGDFQPYQGSQHSFDKWVHVRVYRRGFKTLEITPAHSSKPVDWEPVYTDEERAMAIDQLVGVQGNSIKHLKRGSVSPKHTAFIRYAITEYEELARSMKQEDVRQITLRNRLLETAANLRWLLIDD